MSTVLLWLAVGVLGGLASIARFALHELVSALTPTRLPLGTLAVNLSGSFALGLLVGLGLHGDGYLLAGTAVLGSYTTFSTWMFESERLAEGGGGRLLAVNLAIGLVTGVAAVALGRAVAEVGGERNEDAAGTTRRRRTRPPRSSSALRSGRGCGWRIEWLRACRSLVSTQAPEEIDDNGDVHEDRAHLQDARAFGELPELGDEQQGGGHDGQPLAPASASPQAIRLGRLEDAIADRGDAEDDILVGADLADFVDDLLDPVAFRIQAKMLCEVRDFARPVRVRVGNEHDADR